MSTPADSEAIKAAAELLNRLDRASKEAEAGEPHSIIVRDPETDRWEVFGPWPNRLQARVAEILLRKRHLHDDPEFANFEYRVAIHYPASEA